MMGFARGPLSCMPGLTFWKLCGSGTGEGFTPKPNTAVWGVLCVWQDQETARAALQTRAPFRWYHANATESWTVFLRPISSRGSWSGQSPFAVENPQMPDHGIVALTRATIKPSILMQFWRRVPDISGVIGDNSDVLMKIGLGEVPFLHQITFSIWPDLASMARFARDPGPHAAAIQAVRDGKWFREELYARFAVLDEVGHWNGQQSVTFSQKATQTQ